jgi:hypothetical protein
MFPSPFETDCFGKGKAACGAQTRKRADLCQLCVSFSLPAQLLGSNESAVKGNDKRLRISRTVLYPW